MKRSGSSFHARIRSPLAALAASLAIAAQTLPAFALGGTNGNVQGEVVEGTAKTPVVGATVQIVSPSGTYMGKTDAHGHFAFLGVPVDTYTISVQAPGEQPFSEEGVSVIGDQNVQLGQITVTKQLRTIGTVQAHSISSAFQAGQTTDSVTLNSARIEQTTGKRASTNENAVLLAAPGATLTSSGNITIRGGLQNETGYQYDGVPFTDPFLSTNSSFNRFSGLSSVQVVEGAGDATQGNVGGGVVNLVPKRGTYPGTGLFDAEIGLPGQYSQGALEYGIASRDGSVSDFFSYYQTNNRLLYGYPGTSAAEYGNFYNPAAQVNSDLTNNFVLSFGKGHRQSLQVLYKNQSFRSNGIYGGYTTTGANPSLPFQIDPYAYGPLGLTGPLNNDPALLASILPTLPGQASVQQQPAANFEQGASDTSLLKLEYDNQIDKANYLRVRAYNVSTFNTSNYLFGQTGQNPNYASTGGQTSGLTADFIHNFTPNYTFTFNTQLNNIHPIWNGYNPYELAQLMTGAPGLSAADGVTAVGTAAGSGAAPSLADFVTPVNGVCPVAGGCYVSQYAANQKLPISGVNYNQALFQTFGFAIRNQINVRDRLKLDLGARYDGAIYRFGPNPFNTNPADLGNPSDVSPSYLTNKFENPRAISPRAAIAYNLGKNDALRASYGRSITFLNAQTAGTPAGLYNANALMKVPALDTAQNPQCGTGLNGDLFKCANYAQQLYWLYDQNFDAPDLGNATAQTASNYDLTYQHQFANGFALRFTPFYKLSTGLPSFALLSETVDPTTGQILSEVFNANNNGINRTTGVEFGLTSPERSVGLSGFFTATYQNVLDSAPPLIVGEDTLPIISSGSLTLGNVYRAGYVSPFSARLGVEYKSKNGLRILPVLQYDRGYPFNVGLTTASSATLNGAFANIPQVNFGAGATKMPGFNSATGPSLATQYVDPALPGNAFNPNVAATRGTPESSSTGGALFRSQFTANLTIELHRGRNTIGVQATNLFGNQYYGLIPQVNPYYQPVSTGVSGPQTSQVKQTNPAFAGGIYANRGYANVPANANAFTNGAYLYSLSTGPTPTSLPAQPTQFHFYYQLGL